MQRVEPSLWMSYTILVSPLDAGAVEHLSVILQQPYRQRRYVLLDDVSRHSLLIVGPHGLPDDGQHFRLECTPVKTHLSNIGMIPSFFNSS